ncbi:MAG: thioredoxin family protein [Opitutales bacterium]|nr:thioredoxin family protein [Opitutales bacterium]
MFLLTRWMIVTALVGVFGIQVAQAAENTGPARDRYVEAELVLENTHVRPGETVRAGLRLDHDEAWHTYWKVTTTGYATSLDQWELPHGVEVGDLQWIAPVPYNFEGYIEYILEHEVVLPFELTIPESAEAGDVLYIEARSEWLMCKTVCIPGRVRVGLEIPVSDEVPEADERWIELFAEADKWMPVEPEAEISAWRSGDQVHIALPAPSEADSVYFFDEQVLIVPEMTQTVNLRDDGRVEIVLNVDPAGSGSADRLLGVLRSETGWSDYPGYAWIVDVPLEEGDAGDFEAIALPTDTIGGLFMVFSLAFAGGLILNLMPCVFPVLGIKIMGFVQQAGSERGKIVAHGLVFTAGVMASFWLLAGVLIALRSGGQELGWGFQLQSPLFVYGLAVFLLLFALNMSGLFEIGQSAVGVGSNLTAKSGFSGSFFSGVLATVVATPCAAPFLAPALGAALALPPITSLLVFTAIAAGLAFPYLFLSIFPQLVQVLPKPGVWMESFKQFMSFLLYATVGYLVWILAGQLTDSGGYDAFSLLLVFFSMVVIAMAAWIYGRWGAFHRPKRARMTAYAVAGLTFLMGLGIGYPRPAINLDPGETPLAWKEWAPGKAEELHADGRIVYVDFTARWCVTCQTNKAAVFGSSEVRRWIRDNDVALLIADWTNQDPRITEALAAYNRSAIPFNLVYGPAVDEPEVLPELLTPGIVMERFRRVSE